MSGNEKREPLIQVQNLGKSFGKIDVLKDITVYSPFEYRKKIKTTLT